MGGWVSKGAESAGFTIRVLGLALLYTPGAFVKRRRFREIVTQMYFCGVKALAVTTVVALFTGMILALQGGIELKKFGQADKIGLIVAASMCREMGPMITAIILSAMVGSTIAAELGTMKVSDEIDALEVMSINPVRMLVTPRLIGLMLMTFVLTVLVNLLGVLGGGLVAAARLGVPFGKYMDYAQLAIEGRDFLGVFPKDVYTGLVKSLVFGGTIAAVACAQGLMAKGGALGVGRAVRRTVVASIMMILIFGYILTAFFYAS
jgi:phospholipid/cholesterol/gamma-HCH transport system permease protein